MKNRKYGKKLTFKREKETKNTVRYQEQFVQSLCIGLLRSKTTLMHLH